MFKFKYFAITKPNALDNVFWWCPCVKTCFLNYICSFKSFVSIFLLRICKRFFEGFTPPCDTSQIGHFQLSLKLNVRIRVSNVSVFQLIHLLEAKSEVTLRSPSFRFNQASIIISTNYSVAISQLTNPKWFPLVTQILHSEPIVIYKWNPISTWSPIRSQKSSLKFSRELIICYGRVKKLKCPKNKSISKNLIYIYIFFVCYLSIFFLATLALLYRYWQPIKAAASCGRHSVEINPSDTERRKPFTFSRCGVQTCPDAEELDIQKIYVIFLHGWHRRA